MRSPSGSIAHADLSTRARVRQAAIARFGRDGFDVGLRTIAHDAGVSAATIVKLFGSKEALREACDEYVFATIRESKRSVLAEKAGAPGAFLGQMARMAEYRPLITYALRSLQAGGDTARSFIDHMVADAVDYVSQGVAAGLIVPSRDEKARIRFLIGATLGSLLIEMSTAPEPAALETDEFWERALAQLALPALELYTEGFLTDRSLLETYLLYMPDPPMDAADATV